jgi:hypothetical protein
LAHAAFSAFNFRNGNDPQYAVYLPSICVRLNLDVGAALAASVDGRTLLVERLLIVRDDVEITSGLCDTLGGIERRQKNLYRSQRAYQFEAFVAQINRT